MDGRHPSSEGYRTRLMLLLALSPHLRMRALLLLASMVTTTAECARCGCSLSPKQGFVMASERRCLRCTLMRWPLLRRSLLTGLVVGTFLTAINQGNHIVAGELAGDLIWKIPLTYCVPFSVATWGALVN